MGSMFQLTKPVSEPAKRSLRSGLLRSPSSTLDRHTTQVASQVAPRFPFDFAKIPIHAQHSVAAATTTSAKNDADDAGPGGSAAPVPAQAPAKAGAGAKTVNIYGVTLPGATRDPFTDAARADAIWSQCSLKVNMSVGESWRTDVLDQQAPKGSLNEFSTPTSPTQEELALLDHHPGGKGMIHAYFVPAMSAGSRGEDFRASTSPNGVRAVIISDSAASDTFAHELGHILFDDGNHHSDPDNLMADGSIRKVGVDKLDAAQCSKV